MVIALGIVVTLLVAMVVFIAVRPSDFRIERIAQIEAPPEVVFANLNDLHQWERWSPWDKRDPNLKRTYSGAAEGTGAVYDWDGNKNIGAGRMTIVESTPNQHLGITLDFFRPFMSTNQVKFVLTPTGRGTRVSWSMAGTYNFISKAMGLCLDMDKMIGNDFEQGLVNLNMASQTSTVSVR